MIRNDITRLLMNKTNHILTTTRMSCKTDLPISSRLHILIGAWLAFRFSCDPSNCSAQKIKQGRPVAKKIKSAIGNSRPNLAPGVAKWNVALIQCANLGFGVLELWFCSAAVGVVDFSSSCCKRYHSYVSLLLLNECHCHVL